MKTIFLALITLMNISVAYATGKDSSLEEFQEFHANLLISNYIKTSVTAWVKITDASIHEKIPPIYTKYKFKCEILEIFKGPKLNEIEYIRFMETLNNNELNEFIGKTGLISVFFSNEKNQYYIGDNGYNLPDTPHLLRIARELKSKNKK